MINLEEWKLEWYQGREGINSIRMLILIMLFTFTTFFHLMYTSEIITLSMDTYISYLCICIQWL